MKFIFDFDDVLFNSTKQFKEHTYECLEKAGIPRTVAEKYYIELREKEFSLKKFIATLLNEHNVTTVTAENVFEEIMAKCPDFVNQELLEVVKKLGKENCYIVTYGDEAFQIEKIERSGIAQYFSKIYPTTGSKKNMISEICAIHPNEKIIFVDDKIQYLEEANSVKCPNLKTVLFDGGGLSKLKKEISAS